MNKNDYMVQLCYRGYPVSLMKEKSLKQLKEIYLSGKRFKKK